MKKITLLALLLLIGITLVACSNEQIKEAIDDCRDDEECKEIIDKTIEEELTTSYIIDDYITAELESRGISGGNMTLDELEKVYEVLDSYPIYSYSFLELVSRVITNNEYYESTFNMSVDETYQIVDKARLITDYADHLSFRERNTENRQYFIYDEVRYIVFKEGIGRFTIEIQGDEIIEFSIDVELNKLYINGTLIDKNYIDIFDSALSGIYNFENSNENQIIINQIGEIEGYYYFFEYVQYLNNGFSSLEISIEKEDDHFIYKYYNHSSQEVIFQQINEFKDNQYNFKVKEFDKLHPFASVFESNILEDAVYHGEGFITEYGSISNFEYMSDFDDVKMQYESILNGIIENLMNHIGDNYE